MSKAGENRASEKIVTRVSASGATVYMNLAALRKLIAELESISNAAPESCYEVHLGALFSYFDANDAHISPNATYSDGLQAIVSEIADRNLRAAIADGVLPHDAFASPFEITVMHVSDDALRSEGERPSD